MNRKIQTKLTIDYSSFSVHLMLTFKTEFEILQLFNTEEEITEFQLVLEALSKFVGLYYIYTLHLCLHKPKH